MSIEDPDRELVEQAKGELPYGTTSYNALVRRYSHPIYRRCYRILRSEADAEEVSQEVFLAVFRNLQRFRFEKPFSHWINTVTLNACRMKLRKRAQETRRRDALEREPEPVSTSPAADPLLKGVVLELLDQLDPANRIPLLLHYVEGRTYAEVAQELELSESAVKMRVSRGAKKLRELFLERRARAGDAQSAGAGESGGADE